jgi:hypothetical protein
MDLTMLQQLCHRGNLEALLDFESQSSPDNNLTDTSTNMASLLVDERDKVTGLPQFKEQTLTQEVYSLLLAHLRHSDTSWSDHTNLPHPKGAKVLSPDAHAITHTRIGKHTFAVQSAHPGNSAIFYRVPGSPNGTTASGYINSIYMQEDKTTGVVQTFILVQPHKRLSNEDLGKNIIPNDPQLNLDLVYADHSPEHQHLCFLGPLDIIAHTAYWTYKREVFGTVCQVRMLVNLDWGRSDIVY